MPNGHVHVNGHGHDHVHGHDHGRQHALATRIGEPAPAVAFPDLDGMPVDLADGAGPAPLAPGGHVGAARPSDLSAT
jgi:hypothetical protein